MHAQHPWLSSTLPPPTQGLVALAGGVPPAKQERVVVREFAAPGSAAEHPELLDPELRYLLSSRRSFGIAFSGGGTRAASATWGQLRAINELGWLQQARYLSAVSGGAWTVIPFAFLPDDPGIRDPCPQKTMPEKTRRELDRRFLEAYKAPEELEYCDLKHQTGSFIESLSKTRILGLFLSRFLLRQDETYSRALGKRFLDRIGQYNNQPGSPDNQLEPKHRYFVAHCGQRNRIADASDDLIRDDFTVMTRGRPFLIAGSSLLAKKRFAKKDRDFYPVEITPLYTGVPEPFELDSGRHVGGGYVESPAYDSFERTFVKQPNPVMVVKKRVTRKWVRHRYRFTLSDAMGATGAAPARVIRALGWNLIGFPEFNHFAIGEETTRTFEYAHGDGGHIDNLGLIPLLRRGTESLLVFVNSQQAFRRQAGIWLYDKALRRVFEEEGWLADSQGSRRQALLDPRDLAPIVEAFARAKQSPIGRPLVHCGRFRALDNQRFGIRRYRPRICWVYLDRTQQWLDALPDSPKLFKSLKRESSSPFHKFRGFPHYKTFLQRGWKGRVIDLSEEQVNALAHLTAWTVMERAEYLTAELGLGPSTYSAPQTSSGNSPPPPAPSGTTQNCSATEHGRPAM